MKSYEEMNAGKPMQRYRITKPGAKHGRPEVIDGKSVYVVYSGPDSGIAETGMEQPNEIVLTDADALKLRHMRLMPLVGTRKGIIVGEEKAETSLPNMTVDVPADWQSLAADDRKALASKISGHLVTRVKDADPIIQEYLDGRQQT